MTKALDLTGKRFGRLTVLSREARGVRPGGSTYARWRVECDCKRENGSIKTVDAAVLLRGHTRSCGCLCREMTIARVQTHGMTLTPEWRSWQGARQRCTNPKDDHWAGYGGRGIKMCPKWLESFEQFYRDMGPRPKGMTLERIDVNGDYSPANCQWAGARKQANNRRNNVTHEFYGRNLTLAEAAREYNRSVGSLKYWLNVKKYTPNNALVLAKVADPKRKRGAYIKRT